MIRRVRNIFNNICLSPFFTFLNNCCRIGRAINLTGEEYMKKALIIIAVIIAAVVGYAAYLGVFAGITVEEREMGPFTFVYKEHKGPYGETGKVFTEIEKSLKADGIETTRGFGIYYDDPKQVKKEELRSIVGSVLEEKHLARANEIGKKFGIKRFEKSRCVTAEFPVRGMLAYWLGPMKVYPRFDEYMNAKGYKWGPALELYDMQAKKIIFAVPIKK